MTDSNEPEVKISKIEDENPADEVSTVPKEVFDQLVERVEQKKEFENLKVSISEIGGFIHIVYSRPIDRLVLTKQHAREYSRRVLQETLK